MKNLVIVESPTKAKTISKFLSNDFKVESSFGHVRDLPQKEMGIDIEHDFKPKYEIPEKAKARVAQLKKLAASAGKIWYATDEDREGEAIAWHLEQLIGVKGSDMNRIVFHEVTKPAIEKALEHPRQIDMNIVDAQQARRVLDRLVGYELSPFLWKKVGKGLSAGRVQSVAVRLVVEREREIQNFKKEEYWTIDAIFNTEKDAVEKIEAKLHSVDGVALKKFDINTAEKAEEFLKQLKDQKYSVAKIETKENIKKAPEPYRTSTLQQDANNKLGFSSKETMMLAQQLYEGIDLKDKGHVGLITYMRTDSLNLSEEFLNASKQYIIEKIGKQYALPAPRKFKAKNKGAQEAHEAIRPTHVAFHPDDLKASLAPKQFKLYNLIWRRSVACQMADAVLNATSIDIDSEDHKFTFRATGQTIKFDGFMKIYQNGLKENILPTVSEKENLKLEKVDPTQHFTQPPSRYSEAALIKVMEEYGIGRPSTYAPTISTIQDRNYVVKEEKKLKPTDIGMLVNDILMEHFPKIVDYEFTAKMEKDLDKIEEGKKEWQPIIKAFYEPFKKNLIEKTGTLKKKTLTEEKTDEVCEKCGSPMVIKTGRYGRFLACSNYPKCKNAKNLDNGTGNEKPAEELTEEICPKCGAKLAVKSGRYGKFLSCSKYPDCKYIKSFSQNTGVVCPSCNKGEIVSRKSRGNRVFYACNKYPDCKFTLWGRPTGEKCADCGSLIVENGKDKKKCSNKDCKTNKKVD
ncbi:MAG: type I DNA topoisomerase [Parcubacteria group bacterium]